MILSSYKYCMLTDNLTIGSAVSQRVDDITRHNHRIYYRFPGSNVQEFGEVQFFIQAISTSEEVKNLAWVRNFENTNINREKRIASFGKKIGRRSWINTTWIISLIGVIRDRNMNLIISDADLFDDI